jgi:hypothetical protein
MPLRNKEEFICFTKNKCHVRPAAITQFYIMKHEVTSSYSGLWLLQHSPMPNLSHFSHACVRATHTCVHEQARAHKHIMPTNQPLSKHSEWLQTKLVGVLLPEAVLETSYSHCLNNSEAHLAKSYVLTGGKADHMPPFNKPHHCSCD